MQKDIKSFQEYYQIYNKELKPFIRLDQELFDLLLISPIQSFDYIINRDISIFFKPYTTFSIETIIEKLKLANQCFEFFYKYLEESLSYDDIIIPMIRYYLLIGSSRKIFGIFLEFYKIRKNITFLNLIGFLISKESTEYQTYDSFFEKLYAKEIVSYLNSDNFFLFYFKKNFEILKERLYFSEQIKNQYIYLSKRFDDYKKILLNNWFLKNFISSGNIYAAFQFYLWTTKNENFHYLKEYTDSWNLKLSMILLKNHKFLVVKHLNHKDFYITNKEEIYTKFYFLFEHDNFDKTSPSEIHHLISQLLLEFNLYNYYKLLINFFEDIFVIGLEWNEKLNDYFVNTDLIWLELQNHHKIEALKQQFLINFYQNHINNFNYNDLKYIVLYILYKYRKKVLYYAGFDPNIRALFALFYEKYKPFVSLKLYKGNPHPLVIFRLDQLYKDYPNTDIIKRKYLQLKFKKITNLM